jgi:hypothetical protein
MESARTSETLGDNHFTQQYIPEDKSELHFKIVSQHKLWQWSLHFPHYNQHIYLKYIFVPLLPEQFHV